MIAHRNHRRGIALIWLAIMGLVLLGIAGLAIDTGYTYLVSAQYQTAADAAAISAAIQLPSDASREVGTGQSPSAQSRPSGGGADVQ